MNPPVRLSPRPVSFLGGLLLAACLPVWAASPASAFQDEGRVIVIGFDGADARTTQAMMDAGELPNLKKLAEQGTFAPLVSTNPAESAAGWAAINTGRNPVENNVPSFFVRNILELGGTEHVSYGAGHFALEDQSIADIPLGFPHNLLAGKSRSSAAAIAGGAVFLLFFVLLGLLLRMNKKLSLVIGLLMGGVGAFAAARGADYLPSEVPGVYVNQVRSDAFWDHAARGGAPAVVLDAALAFGRPETPGARVLSGLGIPCVRGGTNGEWFIYSTDDVMVSGSAGSTNSGSLKQVQERDGKVLSSLEGPQNYPGKPALEARIEAIEKRLEDPNLNYVESGELRKEQRSLEKQLDGRVSVPLEIERGEGEAVVRIGDETQTVKAGAWSDYFRVRFRFNPLFEVAAITRVKLLSLDEFITLYVGPLEIDPSAPPAWQPVSSPASFSAQLEDWIEEPYGTLGWSCMTNQMKDDEVDPVTYLEGIEFTMSWRKKLTLKALERDDWRLLFSVYSTTDRVQHMLYRFHDLEHPKYDAEVAARKMTFFGEEITVGEAIPAIYRQMDLRVGEVLQAMRPGDTLMLCADHGFTSFRREFDVNAFLVDKGFLALKDGVSGSSTDLINGVDWSKTRAYSLGLGMVFLNLEGREPNGIVKKEDARIVLGELQAAFTGVTDPASGANVVRDTTIVMDLYPGNWETREWRCADLMLGMDEYYRIAWRTVSGRIGLRKNSDGSPQLFKDNSNAWSGDHASNSPELVTGIFFSSERLALPEGGANVFHIAPTVLDRLGVAVPEELDEAPLPLQ